MRNKKYLTLFLIFLPFAAFSKQYFWINNSSNAWFSFAADGQCSTSFSPPFAPHSISKVVARKVCPDRGTRHSNDCIVTLYSTKNCSGFYSAYINFDVEKGITAISGTKEYIVQSRSNSFQLRISDKS